MAKKRENLFDMSPTFNDNYNTKNKKNSEIKNLIKTQKEHQLHIKYEKRKGKAVTLVGVFNLKKDDLKALHKRIKKILACGGSIEHENGVGDYLLFQGNHKDEIKIILKNFLWKFKK